MYCRGLKYFALFFFLLLFFCCLWGRICSYTFINRYLAKKRRDHPPPRPFLYARHLFCFLGTGSTKHKGLFPCNWKHEAQGTAKEMVFHSILCLTKFPPPYQGPQFPSPCREPSVSRPSQESVSVPGGESGSRHISGFIFKIDPKKILNKTKTGTSQHVQGPPFLLWEVNCGLLWLVFIFALGFTYSCLCPSLYLIFTPLSTQPHQVRGQSTSSGLSICLVSF